MTQTSFSHFPVAVFILYPSGQVSHVVGPLQVAQDESHGKHSVLSAVMYSLSLQTGVGFTHFPVESLVYPVSQVVQSVAD